MDLSLHAYHCSIAVAILCILPLAISAPVDSVNLSTSLACHYMPGDTAWPTQIVWSTFNESIGGKVILACPLAQVCHGSNYDPASCSKIRDSWTDGTNYYEDPVHIMSPYWLNNSCSPFTEVNAPCSLGNMASYAVKVQGPADVAAGLKFAKEMNIRVTIKNTGHDYLGRSAGEGSLALWTHNLKDISFFNYSSPAYNGPAAKAGAGIQFSEVYQAAAEHGYRIVGGLCPTVGMVGGYVQGAGHGPLSGTYGLAADNVLEFEVVTTDGQLRIASPYDNPDLYWALSGGGSGNYGVVLSLTTKAHTDGIVAGASLTFNNTNTEAFWSAVEAWHKHLLVLDQVPGFAVNWGVTQEQFVIRFATLTDSNASALSSALDPFIHELQTLNLAYTFETVDHSTYYEHFQYYTTAAYVTNDVVGSRLVQRSTVQNSLPDLMATIRSITATTSLSVQVNGETANVSHARAGNAPDSNAVLPAWRDSLYHLMLAVSFDAAAPDDELERIQAQLNEWQDQIKVITPGGGAYMNEATYDNVDWKVDYYGANYDKLLGIKEKYDPDFTLWAHTSVGSDSYWAVAEDGRLCAIR
ncbi:hypothetical protein F5B20DRAFT_535046 [Whalleya microplaca]|nr:hypothetical protein F5B20DRAFT_535046 [Whalleya microplaca]